MENFIGITLFSVINAVSCCLYFGTIAQKREWRQGWTGKTVILVFAAGFMLIAYTPVPPYIFPAGPSGGRDCPCRPAIFQDKTIS